MGEGRVMRYIALKINFDKFLILLFSSTPQLTIYNDLKYIYLIDPHKNKYFQFKNVNIK